MAEEKIVSSREIYSGQIIKLRVDTVRMPDDRKTTREIIEHSEAMAAIPVDAAGNILLVEQFRYAVGKTLLEVPAGGIEPGENTEDAVRRELREEIGYLPGKVTRLGGFYSAPGFCTEYLHLYLATELTPSPLHAEDTDGIEVVPVKIEQIYDLIASGSICDAKTIAGLLFFMKYRSEGLA